MIQLKNITIETRHSILRNVSFDFLDGKIYGIVAENGSGKTTLFRNLVNLRNLESGEILYDDCPYEQMSKNVFYFEDIEWLDGNLNGLDYLKFVKKMWNSNVEIEEVIKKCNMNEYIKVPIRKYSLGMKKRLIIGMYLISDAKFMIMDEITNGLDEQSRKIFFNYLHELKDQGKLLLISSHYKDEIVKQCDVVLQIQNENLVEATL